MTGSDDERVTDQRAPIEFRHLKHFLTAVDRGSFRQAAARLNVRPSTVSRRVRDMEDMLGASLFVREPSGLRLTNAGQRICWRMRSIMHQIVDATASATSVLPEFSENQLAVRCAGSSSTVIALTACVQCRAFQGYSKMRRMGKEGESLEGRMVSRGL